MDISTVTSVKTNTIILKTTKDSNIYNSRSVSCYPETIITNLSIPDPLQITNLSVKKLSESNITSELSIIRHLTVESNFQLENDTTKFINQSSTLECKEIATISDLVSDVQTQINTLNQKIISAQSSIIPLIAGMIIEYAGNGNQPPVIPGFLYCDGRQYKQSDYPDLYYVIGDVFQDPENNIIDGPLLPGNFRVPDLQGLFTRMTTFGETLTNVQMYDPVKDTLKTGSGCTLFTPEIDGKRYVSTIPFHTHSFNSYEGGFPNILQLGNTSVKALKEGSTSQASTTNLKFTNKQNQEKTLSSSTLYENIPYHFSVLKYIKT